MSFLLCETSAQRHNNSLKFEFKAGKDSSVCKKMSDSRKDKLAAWVCQVLADLQPKHDGDVTFTLVSGDASFRRYFRFRSGDSCFIAVDAPPERENSKIFVRICSLMHEIGITVPRVFSADYTQGFMLLEDFGDELYLDRLIDLRSRERTNEINSLYKSAIDTLIDIQGGVDKKRLDSYDRNKLHQEMNLFQYWFCEEFLNMDLDKEARDLFSYVLDFLGNAAGSQPYVAVHRDYHSRNLLILDPVKFGERATPGIIDFQDAVSGPYTYDLVSLLRDAYIRWDPNFIDAWTTYYLEQAKRSGLISAVDKAQFLRDFDLMGLQRQLKVIGIFARLSIRDNKPRYLADIPIVIQYFLEVSQRYTELRPFYDWFKQSIEPIASTKL